MKTSEVIAACAEDFIQHSNVKTVPGDRSKKKKKTKKILVYPLKNTS